MDNLIEFAYELDYEKYIEDFEVRQALAILKERVEEMKKDDEWKQKIADEWNKVAEEEERDAIKKAARPQKADDEISYRSSASKVSKASVRSKLESIREEGRNDWDTSTRADKKD